MYNVHFIFIFFSYHIHKYLAETYKQRSDRKTKNKKHNIRRHSFHFFFSLKTLHCNVYRIAFHFFLIFFNSPLLATLGVLLSIFVPFAYSLCTCFGEFDTDRDLGAVFFCGVPLAVDVVVVAPFTLSELSDNSLLLDRQSPSICKLDK